MSDYYIATIPKDDIRVNRQIDQLLTAEGATPIWTTPAPCLMKT